ncbi:MAG: glycosyltransferase family 2 protein [Thermoleophilaceae bacterium]|nr:glycosyltransferase family 2 protein [Thermoleophilaceae bacterium]
MSAIVCAYTMSRLGELSRAVESLENQSRPVDEIIVVIDNNRELMAVASERFTSAIVVENAGARGLSTARNTGVALATGDVIFFLDDDATAAEDWIERILAVYADSRAVGVGGRVEPVWPGLRPSWFPEEFDWVVGCSYRGLPEQTAEVRNMIGANMSFRKEVFDTVGEFSAEIGRVGTKPLGCEETEFCIRVRRVIGAPIVYEPSARISHLVTEERAGRRYFISRCYMEGLSKAVVVRLEGAGDGLSSERTYTTRVLPRGIMRGLADVVARRELSGFVRAFWISLGVAITTAGYLRGSVAAKLNENT